MTRNNMINHMNKILWVNPSFLDYRIPLYAELNKKLKGKFHLLYSKQRIPIRCHNRVREVLGDNAHFIAQEKTLDFGKKSSGFANSSVSIPIPSGLYKQIKDVNPSAIIAEGFFQFTPWALAYSVLHRIPLYIVYERTAHTERNAPLWRRLYRKFIGLFAKGYLANGELTKQYLVSQGATNKNITTGCMCADSYELGRNSQNMSALEKQSFLQSIGLIDIRGLRYIFVGRIIDVKGVDKLLDAWEKHIKVFPDDELLIVGQGDLLAGFIDKYKSLTSIVFTGGVDYSQIYKYYAISDVFIIPTLEDNWSLVVPEAMACGLPIACSIYNGCHPELVHRDINGTTFDPLNMKSLIDTLAYFHCKNLKKMGKASCKIEQNFSPTKVADNIIKGLI